MEEVNNCRPITLCQHCTNCSLQPYTTVVYNRLYSRLDQAQSEDQTILQHTDCWNRNAVRENRLKKSGIESHYICLLRRLHAKEKGSVSTEKGSDMLEMERGTKQGESLSSLLFNTELQMALKDDVERWQKATWMGIRLSGDESDCLTNLRFANDVLLFSTSMVQFQKLMCDFKQSTESVGLKIHPDKTKILSNQSTNKRKEVEINNMKVEILLVWESAKYLGQKK